MLSSERGDRRARIAGIIGLLLGLLLVTWPLSLAFPLQDVALRRWLLVVGALVALCGTGRALLPRGNVLLSLANLLFGFWILLSPFEFPAQMSWEMDVLIVVTGLALVVCAWWSISENPEEMI